MAARLADPVPAESARVSWLAEAAAQIIRSEAGQRSACLSVRQGVGAVELGDGASLLPGALCGLLQRRPGQARRVFHSFPIQLSLHSHAQLPGLEHAADH